MGRGDYTIKIAQKTRQRRLKGRKKRQDILKRKERAASRK
jgi:hypothetical protein